MSSKARVNYQSLAPESVNALRSVNAGLAKSTLGTKLIDLVFLRVSQINGCAYCVDMHGRDLLKEGEDLQRLNSLVTWRETDLYTPRERAALQWADSLTRLTETHAPDEDFAPLAKHFSEREIAELTMVVALMNAWNRIGVGLRLPVRKAPLLPREAAAA